MVSDKMDKTAVVAVIERVRHAKYGKFMMRTKRLYAHDETNDATHRRQGPCHGDPPAEQEQALARRRSAGEGQVIERSEKWEVTQ